LPAHGEKVTVKLRVNRWRCRNRGCAVRFFTLPLDGAVETHARETNRARNLTAVIDHALGGRLGERLMNGLNMATSDDTILRRLKRQAPEPVGSEFRVLGADEWAWSKGQTFGTILVYRVRQAQDQAWREKRRVRELEEMRAKSGGIPLMDLGSQGRPGLPHQVGARRMP
jgi:hypothetical protein